MPFELLIGAAVGAGLASTPIRKALRKGMVYSLAGALMAYDKVSGLAANIRKEAKEAKETGTEAPKKAAPEVPAEPAPLPTNKTAPTEPASTY